MSAHQASLRWAGGLFLLAFGVYGTGMGLASRVLEASDPVAALASRRPAFLAGLALMALSTIVVLSDA